MKVMQKLKEVMATVPAEDLERAQKWYADALGIDPMERRPDGVIYDIGGSHLLLYPSSFAGTNQATAATLIVDDVRGTADGLREHGVTFEQFDMPNTTWDRNVATVSSDGDTFNGAWFRDSEGNIIAITDFSTR